MNVISKKPLLIIPVENQVRELDPKLLLAYIAARRGYLSVIGSHRKIDLNITSFPRSIYLNKSFTIMNLKMFKIMHKLGHQIVSWDEEALVHLPSDMYYARRLSPPSIKYVSHLFAWGEENAELWRQYPEMPRDMPIHVTGNPRGDFLRPEMQAFYQSDAEKIQKSYGDFILINTNFNHVNAFYPSQNLFKPVKNPNEKPQFGKAARGMSWEFAKALRDHKLALFDQFKKLIPALDKAFPKFKIVVRPHPTENQKIYQEIANQCKRVHVTNRGNVVSWLMATKALVHNGCTTGVEAFVMNVPAISYRVIINEDIDDGFYRLPNKLSYQCFSFDQLHETLLKILNGELGAPADDGCKKIVDSYLAAQKGPFACERIIDVLEDIKKHQVELPQPHLYDRVTGKALANGRRLIKFLKSYLPGSHAPPEFHRHRYPGISLEEMWDRILRFQHVLGDNTEMKVDQIFDQIFRISA